MVGARRSVLAFMHPVYLVNPVETSSLFSKAQREGHLFVWLALSLDRRGHKRAGVRTPFGSTYAPSITVKTIVDDM